jgi:hypothetical protein
MHRLLPHAILLGVALTAHPGGYKAVFGPGTPHTPAQQQSQEDNKKDLQPPNAAASGPEPQPSRSALTRPAPPPPCIPELKERLNGMHDFLA